jgi:superfamily II DNA or RNA helicase
MNCNVKRIDTDVEKSFEYLKADGTLDFCKLQNYLASYELRNKQISDKAKELMANGNSVIVLCDRVEQINSIYSLIDSDKAVMLTGAMTSKKGKEQRKQAIEDMRNKDKLCLIASVKLAGTGLDIPCLNSLLWASVQKDEGILTQAVGRISRSLTNKQQPIFYDFVDVNIGYCEGAYKKRLRQYKKLGLNL